MAYNSAPLNAYEAMVDTQRRPSKTFIDWITALVADIDAAPARINVPVELAGQNASIGVTAIPSESLSAGWYRVTVYARATTAATTSSSLIPTITAIDNGLSVTQSGAALTSNSVTLPASWTFFVYSDAASPISYSITYASVGATALVYRIGIVLEQVSA